MMEEQMGKMSFSKGNYIYKSGEVPAGVKGDY